MNKKADKGGDEYKKPNIPDKFLKAYDPAATEERIYKMWEESGYFDPDRLPGDRKEIFTVMLPPPNATGILHLGHALEDSLQDVAVRYARMRGKKALWVPGTDHAAIATNTKVEKEMIKAEGKNRHDIGRDAFIKRVEEFVVGSRGTIQKQIRRMGASCDWSREAFTFDEARSNAVNEAFRKMYEAGLIYRGLRVVNWDPKGQTTVSDDEVQHKAEKGMLYTFRYSSNFPIPIATTRPETKVGDTAVAVNPEDSRYRSFIGKEFKDIDFAGARLNIKIIADAGVDPAYGTGAVGVTPAHSMVDAEMAERHSLDFIQVIDEHARMNDNAGVLVGGKKTKEARQLIVDWLKENGLLEKEESIDMNVSVADRSGGVIEPLPKKQWFVNVNKPMAERGGKTLKQLMSEPVEKGEIKIMPERFEKIYFNWINNLRDWCISRQLWYGHRVPVWHKGEMVSV
ncbi:MAG: class I tRNA ligase family protein, partial [Patescibacteria group bacterium]|nr:class I tRNA ligase family protein [Patescibacteria group bacterium]